MCVLCSQRGLANGQFSGHVELALTSLTPTGTPSTPTSSVSSNYISALLETFNWNGAFGTAANIPFSFGVSFEGGSLFNATERTAAQSAMQQWANVANITFQSASNSAAKLAFSKTTFGGDLAGLTTTFFSGARISQSEVQIDSSVTTFGNGSFGTLVMLHEIGHALGLKHPGAYGSGDTGPYLSAAEDTIQNTVMSYNDGAVVNASNYPVTPMLYDIAAMQYIYGANTSYNAGDSNYSFNGTTTAQAIWDGGGSDTIQVTGFTGNTVIDLNAGPGNITTIGNARVWVAYNANIENAIGNNGNDLITGNDLINQLYGSGGTDTIYGGNGNDVMFGGNGVTDPTDAADLLYGGAGADTIYGNGGNDSIIGGASITDTNDGNDTIYGGNGSDAIYGNSGNDWIAGGGGANDPGDQGDVIFGGAGSDTLFGNGGNDTIYGGTGLNDSTDSADTIYGGVGNDLIYSNGGNDLLVGSAGNDTLHGGGGNDQYRFYTGDGIDVILAFDNPGATAGDLIVLSSGINGVGITTAADALARVTYVAGNAILDLGGGNIVTINGVSALTVDDFAIV
jgi:serralysin